MCFGTEWVRATRLEVPGTPIYVELEDLFSKMTGAKSNSE
jgi:hypothetical protein